MASVFQNTYDDLDYSDPESSDSDSGPEANFSDPGPHPEPQDSRPANLPPRELRPRTQSILRVLHFMDSEGLSLGEILDAISWGDEECTQNAKCRATQSALFSSSQFPRILWCWWKPPQLQSLKHARPLGSTVMMQAFALECTSQVFDKEIENLAKIFKSPAGINIKEEHLTGITFSKLVAQVKAIAPSLWSILFRLARTDDQQKRNPRKTLANMVLIMIAMLSYTRTHHRSRLQKLFAIYFKFRGLTAKGFDTLHAMGLTMSNKWTGDVVDRISAESMEAMKKLMDLFPWLMTYDNAQLTFRVFSQRVEKHTSRGQGTAGTVYIKRSAKLLPSDIHKTLQEMRKEGMAHPLEAFDIFEIAELADKRRYPHTIHLILQILFDSPEFNFATYAGRDSDLLQRPAAIYQLPVGKDHVVLQYLLGTLNIPEASYEDNAKLILEWLQQLGRDSPEWQKKLSSEEIMAWAGDQLTMDCLRNLFRFRAKDDNFFERLDWLVMSPGWLHISMAFANSIHKQHLGTSKGRGLLAAFDVLGRTGLHTQRTEGPFFHDLNECLHFICEAQIRQVWMQFCSTTLADLRNKTPEELYHLAQRIVSRHASNEALAHLRKTSVTDDLKAQSIMFLSDVIPYVLLRDAIQSGDVGIMEDMIPVMLYRFIGGKNADYMGEMLELLQGLHREWPPEICEFVRENCWVINNTGRPFGFMPVDEAQEMNIKDIKVTYRSEGPNIDWQYLKKLHPAIHVIRAVNAHMETEFKTRIRSRKHTVPKKELDLQELQKWYAASTVHTLTPGRIIKRGAKSQAPDIPKDVMGKGSAGIQTGVSVANWVETRTIERSSQQDWDTDSSDSE